MKITDNVTAIILAGRRDFGRCPIEAEIPLALWPLGDKSALQCVVDHVYSEGITHAVICYPDNDAVIRESVAAPAGMTIHFLGEHLPLGTGGCLREAAKIHAADTYLFVPANILSPPGIQSLLEKHSQKKSDLSLVLNIPVCSGVDQGELSGIYLCSSSVLKYITPEGYCDIKERLIPQLLQGGQSIQTIVLSQNVGSFRCGADYLAGCFGYIEHLNNDFFSKQRSRTEESNNIRLGLNVKIAEAARIQGRVLIEDGAVIGDGAIILGPAIIGKGARIGAGAMISNSVLWKDVTVGSYCEVSDSLLCHQANVLDGNCIRNQVVIRKKTQNEIRNIYTHTEESRDELTHNANSRPNGGLRVSANHGVDFSAINHIGLKIAAILSLFIWSYWSTIVDLWQIWMRSDEYSSGMLVPIIVGYIIWSRRSDLLKLRIQPSLWGVWIFLFAQAIRLIGLYFVYDSAERISLIITVCALIILLFGTAVMKKMLYVWLFMFFMLPLPNRFRAMIAMPLQDWATTSAIFFLEILGYDVIRDGNLIHLGNTTVAVAEACNGLRMITAFFVVSGLVIFLSKGHRWQKFVLIMMTLPIALLCNTVRLCLTVIAFTFVKGERWESFFHDFGGYAMIPLALMMLLIVLWTTRKLCPDVNHS